MRDHGGNLDAAMARYGGAAGDWIDLSTGINPRPYPVPDIPASAWAALPTEADMAALGEAAARAYGAACKIAPVAGAQAAIQMIPALMSPGKARVLGPTYNEHAGALRAAGWDVQEVRHKDDLAGADLAVLVNPNNPDGRRHAPETLLTLAERVGLLVVDESFVETAPELSVIPYLTSESERIVALRSFGKFFGLAGLRLGFATGCQHHINKLREMAGPWPVSGPAITIGCAALNDTAWQEATRARLGSVAARLDQLAEAAGWAVVGGTPLFRLYETGDAAAAQARLARAQVWSRTFPYSRGWLRLGLPDGAAQWARVEAALA
ncbi:threonine-phosphate decarboxylase CobD [Dichotomicrobium thermohalophilum]|uniref:threonine-phosphate decarboxylase n=1 Tax=Dichotomicrobium thermohalophilum TaxID=933063 RepID=A0A397PAQ2_9HYPH|nr:threonine-phosphate decarboxylase CobD [Dichotomicrobium thermohalophilum]RIA45463.1 L-threonine O-3-phosphate decarboxylase [Dichotomicrobium thermohalophilum]